MNTLRARFRKALGDWMQPLPLRMLVFGVVLLLSVPASGLFYHLVTEPARRARQFEHLEVIAAMRAGAIEQRLAQHQAQAAGLMLDEGLVAQLLTLTDETSATQARIHARLQAVRKLYGLRGLSVLSPTGALLLHQGEPLLVEKPPEAELLQRAFALRQPVSSDLYKADHDLPRWDYLVPLLDSQGRPAGALWMALDVPQLLSGMLQWPQAWESGRFQLVRQDAAGDVQVLDGQTQAGESLRWAPVNDPALFRSLMRGDDTPRYAGKDSRGESVMAVARTLSGSHWALLAQVDEVDAMLNHRRAVKLILSVGLVFVSLLLFVLAHLWRQQRQLEVLEMERARVADRHMLQRFFDLPFVGMAVYGVAAAAWGRANESLCRTLGMPPDQVPDLSALVAEPERAAFSDALLRLIEGRAPDGVVQVLHLDCPDGRRLSVRIGLFGCTNAEGRVDHVLATLDDLTERLLAERALRVSEARLQAIFTHAAAGIGVLDRQGRWLRVNQYMSVITGYPESALLGRDYLGITHPEDSLHNRLVVDAVWRGELASQTFEKRYLRPDGMPVWVEVSISLLIEQGEPLLLSIVIDISARKAAEQALLLQSQRLQRAEKVAGFGNWELDLTHGRIRGSAGAAAIYGLDGEYWEPGRVRELCLPEYRERLDEALQALIHRDAPFNLEYRICRADDQMELDIHSLAEYDPVTRTVFGVIHDITRRKHIESRLEFLAQCDPLTALPNRTAFTRVLEQALARQKRRCGQLAVLMLDLDRFKDVNDSFGHQAGDELLKLATLTLGRQIRDEDVLARLGGDEFGILIEDASSAQLVNRLASALQEVLRTPFVLSSGNSVEIGVSIGISLYPDHGVSAEELIQHADAALYQAKAEGRNTFRYYTESLTVAARRRLSLEARLHRALAREDELQVVFQPQWRLRDGQLVGAEALLRWHEPDEGLIPPATFIPVAEESHLINRVTEWVMQRACSLWAEQGLCARSDLHLAVNLSPRSFANAQLCTDVLAVLQRTGFPPGMLELELTEGALMREGPGALDILQGLRDTGVRLSLDDFGTGYSSLAYLRAFPLDVIKIDKRFVDALGDGNGEAVLRAIVELAHVLGFKSLAEGVEQPAQAAFLRLCGCDMYQGFLGSRPLAAADFVALVVRAECAPVGV